MDEIVRRKFITMARKIWLNLSIHQKIHFLKFLSDNLGEIGGWDKMIPRPIKEFDKEFKDFTPTELDRVIRQKPSDKPFTERCQYYVYDKAIGEITPVNNIERTLAAVFEKMVNKEDREKIYKLMLKAFPQYPDLEGPVFVTITKKELQKALKDYDENSLLQVSLTRNAGGVYALGIEDKKKGMYSSITAGDKD